MTYTFDNYTNTGIRATLAATKNWMLPGRPLRSAPRRCPGMSVKQSRIHSRTRSIPAATMPKDPGALAERHRRRALDQRQRQRQCLRRRRRHQQRPVGLQQPAMDRNYLLPQVQRPVAHLVRSRTTCTKTMCPTLNIPPSSKRSSANGGTPFSPQYMPFNSPGLAQCSNAARARLYARLPDLSCTI